MPVLQGMQLKHFRAEDRHPHAVLPSCSNTVVSPVSAHPQQHMRLPFQRLHAARHAVASAAPARRSAAAAVGCLHQGALLSMCAHHQLMLHHLGLQCHYFDQALLLQVQAVVASAGEKIMSSSAVSMLAGTGASLQFAAGASANSCWGSTHAHRSAAR